MIEFHRASYGQGEMRIGVKPGQWGWSFDELVASWQAAEEAGFDILSCFDHVSAVYALFGSFYVGVRTSVADLQRIL